MGIERPGFDPSTVREATDMARTDGEVERARPAEVDNAVAAGVNALLVSVPELVRHGDINQLRLLQDSIQAGVQLAETRGMILEPNERINEIRREVVHQVPEGIKALIEKGRTAVIYGQPTLVRHYHEQLLALLGHEATDNGHEDNALISRNESVADFQRSVRDGLSEAPDRYLDDVLRKLELGLVDFADLMLNKVNELEKVFGEFGVPFDRADFEQKFADILRKTAPGAVDKAILDIRTTVTFGGLDIVDYKEGNILKYLDLLTDRGVERPITNEDLHGRVQEQQKAGLNDGIEQMIQSIGKAIRLGFPESVASYQRKLNAYLASATEAGVELKPASEYAEEVEVVIRTEISDGVQQIVDSFDADLRHGRFQKNMDRKAHEKVDQMVALADRVGVEIEAKGFHDKIDRLVNSINPVA